MGKTKTTIELNGKLYDARTGKIISTPKTTGQVVDGFVRRPNVQQPKPVATKVKPAVTRTKPQHVATKLEKSKTLMRPAVKKPQPVVAKAQHHSEKHAITKKVDPTRVTRAAATERSSLINRFNSSTTSHRVIKKEAALEVIPPSHHAITDRVAHLATATEAQVKHSVDMIEESLRNASAHLETFEDKALKGSFLQRVGFKNKAANLASLSFAGLLLVGFFAYQNTTNIEMRVAAARSGVAAGMPGYSPSGFSPARNVATTPGKVSLTYNSNTSDKKFTITQQASNWSSDSLLSNHVLASKAPFQTYQNEGKTVYIFDNSNATWVNGGVWYKIDGNASLTSDQLLRIASSM